MESLACGCPVLGYPSKSVDCQVLPNSGEFVTQDDVRELTQAVRNWMSNEGQLKSIRSDARRQAESLFDIKDLANQLWTEYESLVFPGKLNQKTEWQLT